MKAGGSLAMASARFQWNGQGEGGLKLESGWLTHVKIDRFSATANYLLYIDQPKGAGGSGTVRSAIHLKCNLGVILDHSFDIGDALSLTRALLRAAAILPGVSCTTCVGK